MIKKIAFCLIFLTMAVSACQGQATPGAATQSAAPAATTAPATSAPATSAPAVTQAPVQITILAEGVPSGLDPDGPDNGTPITQEVMANLSEPLVYYPIKGTNDQGVNLLDFTQFQPRLAQSWDYDPSTFTWTFHLRQGVVNCYGDTFNADDVVYTFARAKSVSGASAVGWFLSNVGSIKGFTSDVFSSDKATAAAAQVLGDEVTKVDDYTVKIVQSGPNALLLPVLTIFGLPPMDKAVMQAHATTADPWSHTWMNDNDYPGWGAYCLQSWEKTSQVVLTANPHYYRGKPAIDKIVIQAVPQDSDRVAALVAGDAQIVEHLSAKEFSALETTPNVKVQGVYGNEVTILGLNFSVPPFDNPLIRQAIAYAMPYSQIVQTAYFGNAKQMTGQIVDTYPDVFTPDTQYSYNVDKAKALLAQAGYPGGSGLNAKFPNAWTLTYVSEKEETLGPLAAIIQTALQNIGITVTLNPMVQAQYATHLSTKRDLPMLIDDQEKPIGVDAGYAMMLWFVSTSKGGLTNFVNYSNPTFDAMFAKMLVEPDPTTRSNDLHQMENILQNDLAWVPLVERETQWATAPNISGITFNPDNGLRYFDLKVGK